MNLVVVKGGSGDYVVGRHGCTCMAGSFGKVCKHVKEVERLGFMPVEIGDKVRAVKSFPSFVSDLNSAVDGDFYNSDVIVAVHGKPGVGKTLLALHECAYAASLKLNFLYVDTEGGAKSMIEKWWPVLEKRFQVSGKGYVETRKTLTSLHEFLGFKTAVVWVKEKLEFRILESLKHPEIDEFIQQKKIDFLVIDSVSMPVATAINEEQQNRPARFTATGLIMGKLAELQEKFGVCVLTIHHSSWNPTNPYESMAQMRGGKIVQHYAKRVLYMDMRQKGDLSNFRRLWLARAEQLEKFGDVVFVSIGANGIHFVGLKEGYEAGLLTDGELEYVVENKRWKQVLKGGRK